MSAAPIRDTGGPAQTPRHFMLREIYEQPRAIRDTIQLNLPDGVIFGGDLAVAARELQSTAKIIIAASGSSRHAGLAGEIMIEDLSATAVDVEYASEYSCRSIHDGSNPLVVLITQSGETADTIAAQRQALASGAQTLAICNVSDSTISREAGARLLTHAGPEQAIPATKSFTTQLTVLYMLALLLARERARMTGEETGGRLQRLLQIPDALERSLPAWDAQAAECARDYRQAPAFLYAGRGVHYAIAREGALKLKEVSYAHAEGYPTGELKHGPQALVSDRLPVVALLTCDRTDAGSALRYNQSVPILKQIKLEGGKVLVIACEGDDEVASFADHAIFVPPAPELLMPILEVVPLQLFAYHVARMNGLDVDRPRNLVKAVVE